MENTARTSVTKRKRYSKQQEEKPESFFEFLIKQTVVCILIGLTLRIVCLHNGQICDFVKNTINYNVDFKKTAVEITEVIKNVYTKTDKN